ncbi:MAG TPA: YqeG family HAD IIIA-type phosphatase [Clostridiaceae bacterium]|nr:YqeG family HAD IIIA-type phosphatase [Clostridiaceae bacterium]
MRSYFLPDWYIKDLRDVDWSKLYSMGIRVAMLDKDNTLVAHGSTCCDDYTSEIVATIKAAGIDPVLLSNAPNNKCDVFASAANICVEGDAGKPGTKGIARILERWEVSPDEVVMVGDQLFTDVWAGKRAGVKILLVEQRFRKEVFYVKLKRLGEKIIVDKSQYGKLEDISLSGCKE